MHRVGDCVDGVVFWLERINVFKKRSWISIFFLSF